MLQNPEAAVIEAKEALKDALAHLEASAAAKREVAKDHLIATAQVTHARQVLKAARLAVTEQSRQNQVEKLKERAAKLGMNIS